MNDLISRQMLLEYIHGEPVGRLLCDKYNLDGLIKQFPSAQPERKRGKWIDDGDPFMWECGCCGYRVKRYNNTRYCPNCGADMREDNNETD